MKPKQMNLWDGLCRTGSQSKRKFFKTKVSKVGLRAKTRENAKLVIGNRDEIIRMMKELKSDAQIAKVFGISRDSVRQFRSSYFGKENDPYNIHIVESFNKGESAKSIGRRLQIDTSQVTRRLSNNGISAPVEYRNKCQLRRRFTAKDINPVIAMDLWCWIEEHSISIRELSSHSGFGESFISKILNAYIPEYKSKSIERRMRSESIRKEKKKGLLSKIYKSEKSFVGDCKSKLDIGCDVEVSYRKLALEVDMVVQSGNSIIFIECKISSRKVDFARAVGQVLLQRELAQKNGMQPKLVCCFPDDVYLCEELMGSARRLGICVCTIESLCQIVDGSHEKSTD